MMRRMDAKSIVVEQVDESFVEHERISIEIAAVERRLARKITSEIYKVTFLKLRIDNETESELNREAVLAALDDHFLGYAIVINLSLEENTRKSYIFEAVIRNLQPSGIDSNASVPQSMFGYYLHVQREFHCHVLQQCKPYKLIGTFFAQQNTITNVCAHACALMMLNNCDEITPLLSFEDINRVLGIDHEERAQTVNCRYGDNERATHEGLSSLELEKVFRYYGFKPYKQTFLKENQRYFREFIYGFIESGYPALLTFTTPSPSNEIIGHVVAVVGHTWNGNSWLPPAFANYAGRFNPEKPYLSSLGWIDDLLVHDDNFGMQLSLPAHAFKPEDYPDPGIGFTPTEAIGILPLRKSVKLLAHNAERIAFSAIHQVFNMFYTEGDLPKENYYLEHLQGHILHPHARTAVCRTSLVERSDYLEHLRQEDNKGKVYIDSSLNQIAAHLSNCKRVWLVEVSEPDLYVGNLSKVIDVIINPEFDALDSVKAPTDFRNAIVMIRFPEFLMIPNKIEGEVVEYAVQGPLLDVEGHLPMFRQK